MPSELKTRPLIRDPTESGKKEQKSAQPACPFLIRLPLSERQPRNRSSPAVPAQFLEDYSKTTVCILLYICDTRGAREAAFLHVPDITVSKITITKASASP